MYFDEENITKLMNEQNRIISDSYERVTYLYIAFAEAHPKSSEYALHGFVRRIGTLQRCIQNVYSIYPPRRSNIPSREDCVDLTINLQSFVFNVFGCVDNLAWIWVLEREITKDGQKLPSKDVGFNKKIIQQSLTAEFRSYMANLGGWFKYLESFRHALAHRIPLYIPPYVVRPRNHERYSDLERKKNDAIRRRNFDEYHRLDLEQSELGEFVPEMRHSFVERSGSAVFHAQMLADWNTVAEMAEKFVAQFKEPS